jgi:SAM-dependent methyltransferase
MSDDPHPHHHQHGDEASEVAEWNERYRDRDQIWSGQPNGALVAEVEGEAPGLALDVGCGEGADAVWLARGGWSVTALEVAEVALDRARAAAVAAAVDVDWRLAGLVEADLPSGAFDLVNVQYPALRKKAGGATERALLDAVAPGGTLLFVTHADMDAERAKAHGFDPADYVGTDDLISALGAEWEVEVDAERERRVTSGRGADHHLDRVVRIRRAR